VRGGGGVDPPLGSWPLLVGCGASGGRGVSGSPRILGGRTRVPVGLGRPVETFQARQSFFEANGLLDYGEGVVS
jgi:hypothetical protein